MRSGQQEGYVHEGLNWEGRGTAWEAHPEIATALPAHPVPVMCTVCPESREGFGMYRHGGACRRRKRLPFCPSAPPSVDAVPHLPLPYIAQSWDTGALEGPYHNKSVGTGRGPTLSFLFCSVGC